MQFTKPEEELARRIPFRVYAVQNAGVLTERNVAEVARILTEVEAKILTVVSSHPEFGWSLLDRIVGLGLSGAPDLDEHGEFANPAEERLNEMLLAGGSFDPLVDMKRYRRHYDVLTFCQDMVSEFRCYGLIITKYKPRDAVAEVMACIAEYLAEELILLVIPVPGHVVEILGMARIQEIREREAEADKFDMTEFVHPSLLEQELERQLDGPDLDEQRQALVDFVAVCGDLRELAISMLNFPNDL